MKLTKPLLFLTSTIIGAVSVGSTSLALTKHKPSQTEKDVIVLDELKETIEEKEINPDPAPPPPPPAASGGSGGSSSSSSSSPGGAGSESSEGGGAQGADATEEDVSDSEEGAEDEDEDDDEEEEEEEKDSGTDTNQQDSTQDATDPSTQTPEDEPTKEEIKESLIKIIKSLSEKKDFSLETASLYLLFQTSNEVAQLKSLIEQYQKLDQKAKEAAASGTDNQGNPGSSQGVSSGGAAGSPGVSGDAGSGVVGNGAD